MYKIYTTNRFEKDLKLCKKRNFNLQLLKEVIDLLQANGKLPSKYKPHKLSGNYADCWECRIKSDWLLIWKQNDHELTLLFTNNGTHSDLF
jgi:mRNA interferase YafQ